MKRILTAAMALPICYLASSFIAADANPFNWPIEGRAMLVLVSFIMAYAVWWFDFFLEGDK